MKNNKILTIFLILILMAVMYFLIPKNDQDSLVSPGSKLMGQQSSPEPQVQNYNPPKEIKYDVNTDLRQELDTINPKVLDSDFDSLQNL